MNAIAFVWGSTTLYWPGFVIALAVAAACLMALGLRRWQGRSLTELLLVLPLAIILSFFLCRMLHWYCHDRQYAGFAAAMTDFSVGSFSLVGAFFAAIAAAVLLRLLRVCRDLGGMLDVLAVSGAFGIGIGRFSALFNSFDRGKIVFSSPNMQGLPWSTPMTDALGNVEWRAAVFCWEGIAALLLCAVLLVLFFRGRRRDGELFWLFLALYGAAEVLLDSTRYDSSFLRSNGFVSLVQIVGAVSMLCALAVFSVGCIRRRGLRWQSILRWVLWLAGLGLVGYMEYYVQRHGDLYVMCYNLMALGLCLSAAMIVWTLLDGGAPAAKAPPAPADEPAPFAEPAAEPEPAPAPVPMSAPVAVSSKPVTAEDFELDNILADFHAMELPSPGSTNDQ